MNKLCDATQHGCIIVKTFETIAQDLVETLMLLVCYSNNYMNGASMIMVLVRDSYHITLVTVISACNSHL